jgi:hypothetical protein
LEDIEGRLKQDILAEAGRFGGLVLTHNEIGEIYSLYMLLLLFPSFFLPSFAMLFKRKENS